MSSAVPLARSWQRRTCDTIVGASLASWLRREREPLAELSSRMLDRQQRHTAAVAATRFCSECTAAASVLLEHVVWIARVSGGPFGRAFAARVLQELLALLHGDLNRAWQECVDWPPVAQHVLQRRVQQ